MKYKKQRVLVDIAEGIAKMPPSAVELEEAVLGAAMLERESLSLIIDILNINDFYVEKNKTVWEAIISLYRQDKPIDIKTVTQELRASNRLESIGGAMYLAGLTASVASAANIEYHARIIIEQSIKRSLIIEASKIHNDCYSDGSDVFNLLDSIQSRIDNISASYFKGSAIDANSLYRSTIQYLLDSRNKNGITGISSGYNELDRITGGWQSPDLVIIAARPSMGKTVVGVCIAKQAALIYKKSVAFFSLEMSSRQIMQRIISCEAEVDLEKIVRGSTSDQEIMMIGEKTKNIVNSKFYIDETPAISILELRAKARRLKHEKGIEIIVIDYLQLMRGDEDSGNREQEVASISRGLKSLAKELDIPIIALSQLSRGVENRSDKRPQLSDLRESGAIEQDADVVLFLYRAEYYGIQTDDEGQSTIGKLEIIAAKNRNGKTGSLMMDFVGKFAKIKDQYSIPEFEEINPF